MGSPKTISSGVFFISLLFLCLSVTQARHVTSPHTDGPLRIVAIMVEFEADTNRFTTGNGTFAPGSLPFLEESPTHIDPLPHDRGYFEAHLTFVKNYFERMSGNRLQVDYHVLPDVIRLPHPMARYSPTGQDPELNPLAELAADAWTAVQEKGSLEIDVQSHENTAFVIFHAGVGRDIELTGTTLIRTPQDIPSVYLSRSAISRLLDDPAFSGIPIDNGNLLVSNTLILPRTLSRPGETVTGESYVLPLSINGMATAQIGSHLGLPDLFNTETGESGIGQFGLMDGAGIFAYNGLFPPELSAWEKLHMGWSDSFTVDADAASPVELPAASFRQPNSIARINLSSDEYFLLENRHRDPHGEGVTFTIRTPDGDTVQHTITNENQSFSNPGTDFDEELPPGVITDVSHYDFALPGGLVTTEDTERKLNGGILIWHIDESVIRQKTGREGINSDPTRRGVNLVEADGARDIGRPVSDGFFQNEVNGSPFDFWWSGNDASVITPAETITLYENAFGPDTTPSNHSNSGAPAGFRLYDFSDNLPVASFRIESVSPHSDLYETAFSGVNLDLETYTDATHSFFKRYPRSISSLSNGTDTGIVIPADNGVKIYHLQSGELSGNPLEGQSVRQPLSGLQNGLIALAESPVPGETESEVHLYEWAPTGFTEESTVAIPGFHTGNISLNEPGILDADHTPYGIDVQSGARLENETGAVQRSESIQSVSSEIRNETLVIITPGGIVEHSLPLKEENERKHTGVISLPGSSPMIYLLLDGRLSLFSPETEYKEETLLADSERIGWPAIADFTGNNRPDFLFVDYSQNRLTARNHFGAVLDGFPLRNPQQVRFSGTPLIADLNGDGRPELIIAGRDDYSLNLYAYDSSGTLVDGFPLHLGGIREDHHAPVNPAWIGDILAGVTPGGELYGWRFPDLGRVHWASGYGNDGSNNVTGYIDDAESPQPTFTLLNREETYNWPNPATDETMLRFETSEPAEITVRIATMSGRTIYDRTVQSRGGYPEEIRINTSRWASGAYFAVLTARAGNQTERKRIQIAVVK
jgi:hypothetical protein